MKRIFSQLKKSNVIKYLGGPKLFFFALIWLCFLVVAGTLAQGDIGLYQAQEVYFSSFILWIWWLPLPGGYPTMGIVFLGLVLKLVFYTPWSNPKRLGTIITHTGALLLLFGGFLTAVFSTEGAMVIPEGQSSSFVRDYHLLELAITDRAPKEHDAVMTFAQGWLEPERIMQHADLPFTLEVLEFCRNCKILKRTDKAPSDYKGFAKNFRIQKTVLAKDETKNTAGIRYRLKTEDPKKNGVYIIFENMSIAQTLLTQEKNYLFEIRHKLRKLPFTIELLDFEKKEYPGTAMARSYSSVINLIENGIKQRVVISMNHPLRHQGRTFYQSSFMQGGGMGETTVLAVVNNVGRLFPYISSLIMCVGLLLHLLIQMPVLFSKETSIGGPK